MQPVSGDNQIMTITKVVNDDAQVHPSYGFFSSFSLHNGEIGQMLII